MPYGDIIIDFIYGIYSMLLTKYDQMVQIKSKLSWGLGGATTGGGWGGGFWTFGLTCWLTWTCVWTGGAGLVSWGY
jgi:hypothetical protein